MPFQAASGMIPTTMMRGRSSSTLDGTDGVSVTFVTHGSGEGALPSNLERGSALVPETENASRVATVPAVRHCP